MERDSPRGDPASPASGMGDRSRPELSPRPRSRPLETLAREARGKGVGKLLPRAFYVHASALDRLDPELQRHERLARQVSGRAKGATLVKFSLDQPKVSYLFYPEFDTDAHPALAASVQVDLQTREATDRDYRDREKNPPILHRKETFVAPDYPLRERFARLTEAEVALGLLDDPRAIGTRREWRQRLESRGVEIRDHEVVPVSDRDSGNEERGSGSSLVDSSSVASQRSPIASQSPPPTAPKIERHRAAIVRTQLSRPVSLAVEAGFFGPDTSFFDYGSGHGGDVERIARRGHVSSGWDPHYCPDTPLVEADIVNLGYVINVIEDPAERREALLKAWALTGEILIVAAQVIIDSRSRPDSIAYGDGVITSRDTFQKYYEQEELKAYIDQVLEVDAIPAGLGVYFVFRDPARALSFRASRFHSRARSPRVRVSAKRFEDHEESLAPLMAFLTERGRLPVRGELPEEGDVLEEFGTFRRAYRVILQATSEEDWEAIARQRRQDLLVYLALSKFHRRPKLKELSLDLQQDIKALLGSYKRACEEADDMLYSLGAPQIIAILCRNSPVGLKLKNSLLVHVSALEALHPLLRLYEGCASRTIGRFEAATLVKFHTRSPKISYLAYPDFDTDPHPKLAASVQIDLRDLHASYWEDGLERDSFLLHRKDATITPDYPGYELFAKLARQEEDWGLLDDLNAIARGGDWERRLAERGAFLDGHRLRRRPDLDPYQLKVLRAEVKRRQERRRKAAAKGSEE